MKKKKCRLFYLMIVILGSLFLSEGYAAQCMALQDQSKNEFQNQKYEEAYKLASKAITACKAEGIRSAPAHVLAGTSKFNLGQNDLALIEFKQAYLIDPQSEIIKKNLCAIYNTLNDEPNIDKFCEINQPIKTEKEVQCITKGEIEINRNEIVKGIENCTNKPTVKFTIHDPVCKYERGGKGGGPIQFPSVVELSRVLASLCEEKPDAFKQIKTITGKQVNTFEAQGVKDLSSNLEFNILSGKWNESLLLTKTDEMITKWKTDVRKIFGVKIQTSEELNTISNENSNKAYDDYSKKYKELEKQKKEIINKNNSLQMSQSVEVGKIWSSPGDPTEKSKKAEALQKTTDAEVLKNNLEIEAITQKMDKLSAEQ